MITYNELTAETIKEIISIAQTQQDSGATEIETMNYISEKYDISPITCLIIVAQSLIDRFLKAEAAEYKAWQEKQAA